MFSFLARKTVQVAAPVVAKSAARLAAEAAGKFAALWGPRALMATGAATTASALIGAVARQFQGGLEERTGAARTFAQIAFLVVTAPVSGPLLAVKDGLVDAYREVGITAVQLQAHLEGKPVPPDVQIRLDWAHARVQSNSKLLAAMTALIQAQTPVKAPAPAAATPPAAKP